MTRIDLDELERKARSATGGDWVADRVPGMPRYAEPIMAIVVSTDLDYRGRYQQIADCYDNTVYPDSQNETNAAYIAANSPPVTLALVARIRELEDVLSRTADDPSWELAAEIRALLEKGTVIP